MSLAAASRAMLLPGAGSRVPATVSAPRRTALSRRLCVTNFAMRARCLSVGTDAGKAGRPARSVASSAVGCGLDRDRRGRARDSAECRSIAARAANCGAPKLEPDSNLSVIWQYIPFAGAPLQKKNEQMKRNKNKQDEMANAMCVLCLLTHL